MNLLQILIQSIKARITPIFTRIKLFFSANYIRARITEGIRTFFTKTLSIRPRDKDDYYPVGRWLVSKKLAFALVIVIGVLSIVYILTSWDGLFPNRANDGIKTYSYNNILLKFAKGTVRIKGKSGYLAFEGEVEKGSCNGNGTLMNPQGFVVYQGNFVKSMYENEGTQYYADGTLEYQGQFHENLHSGEGKLYRPNGSLEYDGEFALDKKEGQGTLYDLGHNPVYTGQFTLDDIKYSDLIGKQASDLAEAYKGERVIYQSAEERTRFMPDINAMTVEYLDENSIDTEATVESVYVLKNTFQTAEGGVETFDKIAEYLGQPVYVGSSYATLPEILCVNRLNDASDAIVLNGKANVQMSATYTEYKEVSDYDAQYEVYLRSYQKDGLIYTFVTEQGLDTFYFYYILTEDLSDIE